MTKAYLDEICPDKPLIMNTGDGHSMLLNTKALEWAGIDREYAQKLGPDEVHVDEDGEPDGYICEGSVFETVPKLPKTIEDAKKYLLVWQDIALKNGYTAVVDAGVEIAYPGTTQAYYELEQEGKLKMRTYAYLKVPENADDSTGEVARIVADRARYSGECFHVVGIKTFLGGVVEAHTAWQLQDYLDKPGYHGLERFNGHDKLVEFIVAADAEGMSVHVHTVGDGAVHFMLDCKEDAEKVTGDLDQRNIMAHLEFVPDEDIRRMAQAGTVPAVAPLWTGKEPGGYEMEVAYVGQELVDRAKPVQIISKPTLSVADGGENHDGCGPEQDRTADEADPVAFYAGCERGQAYNGRRAKRSADLHERVEHCGSVLHDLVGKRVDAPCVRRRRHHLPAECFHHVERRDKHDRGVEPHEAQAHRRSEQHDDARHRDLAHAAAVEQPARHDAGNAADYRRGHHGEARHRGAGAERVFKQQGQQHVYG